MHSIWLSVLANCRRMDLNFQTLKTSISLFPRPSQHGVKVKTTRGVVVFSWLLSQLPVNLQFPIKSTPTELFLEILYAHGSALSSTMTYFLSPPFLPGLPVMIHCWNPRAQQPQEGNSILMSLLSLTLLLLVTELASPLD